MATRNDKSEARLTKGKSGQERRITVRSTSYDYKPKQEQYNPCFVNTVPWIQMKGKWLEQAGFSIDTPITVKVMEGCLVLIAEQRTTHS